MQFLIAFTDAHVTNSMRNAEVSPIYVYTTSMAVSLTITQDSTMQALPRAFLTRLVPS